MKLHWSPKSPFVRKVMVVAHELELTSRIELIRTVVALAKVNPSIMADNPLGKIPTLVLANGRTLFDSLVICQYLDHLGGDRLFPAPGDALWDALTRHALAQGLMDSLILWRGELNKPAEQRSADLLAAFATKVGATLDRFETDAPASAALPFDIGHVALGCALSYIDFRFADLGWRQGRPQLAAWHQTFEARPSAAATAVVDG